MVGPDAKQFEPSHRRAIVAGFGPVGRLVAERLEVAGIDLTIIELNPQTVARQRELSKRTVHGNVADPQVLKSAGIVTADALIVTIPDEEAAVQACHHARRLHPGIYIAARANHLSRGMMCTQAGADHVVIDEIVTAEAMQQAVVDRLITQTGPASSARTP